MNTLSFYTEASTAEVTTLDLGAVAPGSSDDLAVRLFNTSQSYLAQDVMITVSGDDSIQLWLSDDGDVFTPSLAVGDLPPQAFSAVFYLRRVTATTDTGSCTAALDAVPTAWTYLFDTSTSTNIALDTEGS